MTKKEWQRLRQWYKTQENVRLQFAVLYPKAVKYIENSQRYVDLLSASPIERDEFYFFPDVFTTVSNVVLTESSIKCHGRPSDRYADIPVLNVPYNYVKRIKFQGYK